MLIALTLKINMQEAQGPNHSSELQSQFLDEFKQKFDILTAWCRKVISSKLNYHQPLKEPQDITLHLNLEFLFLKDKLCQV